MKQATGKGGGRAKGEGVRNPPPRRVVDLETARLMKQLRQTIATVSRPDFSPEARKSRKRHPAGKMSRNLSRLMESVNDDAS